MAQERKLGLLEKRVVVVKNVRARLGPFHLTGQNRFFLAGQNGQIYGKRPYRESVIAFYFTKFT